MTNDNNECDDYEHDREYTHAKLMQEQRAKFIDKEIRKAIGAEINRQLEAVLNDDPPPIPKEKTYHLEKALKRYNRFGLIVLFAIIVLIFYIPLKVAMQ